MHEKNMPPAVGWDTVLEELAEHRGDPFAALGFMEEALDCELAERFGLPVDVVDPRKSDEATPSLTPDQYEGIKTFEELIQFLGSYSDLSPDDLGAWLDKPVYGDQTPLDVLFVEFATHGIHSDDIRTVVLEAQSFLRPDRNFNEDYARLVD